jgi:hypothetical protein
MIDAYIVEQKLMRVLDNNTAQDLDKDDLENYFDKYFPKAK